MLRAPYDGPVFDVQVVLDAAHASESEAVASATSLLAQVARIEVVGASAAVGARLDAELQCCTVTDSVTLDGRPLLLAPAGAAFVSGAVQRLGARSTVPGRIVTRVLVASVPVEASVAWWDGAWLQEQGLDAQVLLCGGLDLDRSLLPHDSGQARAWVLADEIGIEPACDVGEDARSWAHRRGRRWGRGRQWYAVTRARMGAARRRRRLSRQRRRHRG